MNKQIFLNLPVADLAKSKTFFQALGYPLYPQFSGEGGNVMLATHPKFRERRKRVKPRLSTYQRS